MKHRVGPPARSAGIFTGQKQMIYTRNCLNLQPASSMRREAKYSTVVITAISQKHNFGCQGL